MEVLTEVAALADKLAQACRAHIGELEGDGQAYGLWTDINEAKEAFWEETAKAVAGTTVSWSAKKQMELLDAYADVLKKGIEKHSVSAARYARPIFIMMLRNMKRPARA